MNNHIFCVRSTRRPLPTRPVTLFHRHCNSPCPAVSTGPSILHSDGLLCRQHIGKCRLRLQHRRGKICSFCEHCSSCNCFHQTN